MPTVPLPPTVPRLLILVLFLRCLLLPTDAMHLRRFRTGRLFLHRSPSTGPGCPGVPLRIRRHRPYPRQHDGLHAAVDDGTKLRPRPRRGAQHAPLLALPRQVSKGAACGGRCGFSSLRVLVRGRRWGSFQWRNLLYPRPRKRPFPRRLRGIPRAVWRRVHRAALLCSMHAWCMLHGRGWYWLLWWVRWLRRGGLRHLWLLLNRLPQHGAVLVGHTHVNNTIWSYM